MSRSDVALALFLRTNIEVPIPFDIFEIERVLLFMDVFTNVIGRIFADVFGDSLPRYFEVFFVPLENHADIENVLFFVQPEPFSTTKIEFGCSIKLLVKVFSTIETFLQQWTSK